jgi:hypothetical protein
MAVRVTIRHAERADVAAIAAMFAQDTLAAMATAPIRRILPTISPLSTALRQVPTTACS